MKKDTLISTLSCTSKCIRILVPVINKKIVLGIFIISFLGACTAPTAMLGPAYTLGSSGNVFQASLSYGSNYAVKEITGMTTSENIKVFLNKKETRDAKFYALVKKRIEETSKILNLANQ